MKPIPALLAVACTFGLTTIGTTAHSQQSQATAQAQRQAPSAQQAQPVRPDTQQAAPGTETTDRTTALAQADQSFLESAIEMFEQADQEVQDPDIQAMISETLPKLREHLNMARTLNEKQENQ